MSYGFTPQQRAALEFIKGYIAQNGVSPTFAEISDALTLNSKSGVHRLLQGLSERGAVSYLPHRHRSIRVLNEGNSELVATAFTPAEWRRIGAAAVRRGVPIPRLIHDAVMRAVD